MSRRWPVLLLLTGALASLASLYLPWQEASCGPECLRAQGGDVTGLLNLFSGNLSVDGWSSGVGDVAALSALLLAAVAAVALARPDLADRLPLGLGALFVGYFGLAVAAAARSIAQQREVGMKGVDFHYAYGAYLGVAAAAVVVVAAGAMRRQELGRFRSRSRLAWIVVGVALLVAFLLPWERFASPGTHVTFLGIASPAAVVAAALTLCLLGFSWRAEARAERLVLAVAAGLFTGAAFSSLIFPGSHAYGAWIGPAAAIALVALAMIDAVRVVKPQLLQWPALATGAAAALLVAGLFLPWQKACYERASDFGPYSGRCGSTNGWTSSVGAAAALLAIGLVIVTLASGRSLSPTVFAVGVGLLIATFGFQLEDRSGDGVRLEFGYGSMIGFVAAGLLLALTVVRLRPPKFGWNRVPVRLVPIAACAAYLVVVVLPWWDVLPQHVQSALGFAPLSWLTIAGALLAIWLLHLWAERIARVSAGAEWLVIVPLVLLSLAALDLIQLRDDGITWARGTVVGLCLLLVLLGRIEQREGLEKFRVPEVLRVDRI
jgi:hypothetical protein